MLTLVPRHIYLIWTDKSSRTDFVPRGFSVVEIICNLTDELCSERRGRLSGAEGSLPSLEDAVW